MPSTALHAAIAAAPAAVYRTVIDALAAKDDATQIRALLYELRTNENVAVLTSLLDHPAAQKDAAGALWALACDGCVNQDAIRDAGGVPKLVALLDVPGARAAGVPDGPDARARGGVVGNGRRQLR